ncbi:MAG: thioesterase family protein [Gordonia sp.]|nr:thioesterase family protein [Gordonia sp. (in: high G+C Gram-positive bacteria)]
MSAPTLEQLNTLRTDGPSGPDHIDYTAVIDPVFTIGPKVHGGTTQMLSAKAALAGFVATAPEGAPPAAGLAPVAISTNYLGAPDPAEITLKVWVRKRGRTVSLVDVEVHQNGRNLIHSTVTIGTLDTDGHFSAPTPLTALPIEPPDDVIWVDQSPMGDVMHLSASIDVAIEANSLAFIKGEKADPVFRMWARPKEGVTDELFAILSGDLSAPVVMNLHLFGWAPTVQLTTYLRRLPAPGWLRIQASSTEVGHGWFEEDHLVIDSAGDVIVQTRQLALIPASG